jgi:hypothetical protein
MECSLLLLFQEAGSQPTSFLLEMKSDKPLPPYVREASVQKAIRGLNCNPCPHILNLE